MPGEIKSDWRATSPRIRGRDHSGLGGDIRPEYALVMFPVIEMAISPELDHRVGMLFYVLLVLVKGLKNVVFVLLVVDRSPVELDDVIPQRFVLFIIGIGDDRDIAFKNNHPLHEYVRQVRTQEIKIFRHYTLLSISFRLLRIAYKKLPADYEQFFMGCQSQFLALPLFDDK
jgi:hypothetical protein